jgi:DNA polymerase III epsilon subunit-like protein
MLLTELKTFLNYYNKLGLELTIIDKKNNDPLNKNFRQQYGNFLKNETCKIVNVEDINKIDNADNIFGIGLSLKNNGLICIDLDYCISKEPVYKALEILGLPKDYEWVISTGSGVGYHIIVKFDLSSLTNFSLVFDQNYNPTIIDREIYSRAHSLYEFFSETLAISEAQRFSYKTNSNNKNIEKIEFLSDTHSILPTSMHKSGRKYEFFNDDIPCSYPAEINAVKLLELIISFCSKDGKLKSMIRSFPEEYELARIPKKEYTSIVFDVETTGLIQGEKYFDVLNFPEISQIAWIVFDNRTMEILYFESSLNSDIQTTIPANIVALTGIDNTICKTYGRPLEVIAEMIQEDISKVSKIYSYNIEFDIQFLKNIFFRTGKPYNLGEIEQVCIMKEINKYGLYNTLGNDNKWFKLYELFSKIYPNHSIKPHNAVSDTLMAYKVIKDSKTYLT